MPNTREKLKELLTKADTYGCEECDKYDCCEECPAHAPNGCRYGFKADYLIAHGVTVQEWISVVERLPELGVRVLIFDSYQGISIGKALWVASPSMRRIELVAEEDAIDYTEITHWMPLPEPPRVNMDPERCI